VGKRRAAIQREAIFVGINERLRSENHRKIYLSSDLSAGYCGPTPNIDLDITFVGG
jgi:hypothetical protein